MTLLKDELMQETGLTEELLKIKLDRAVPQNDIERKRAQNLVDSNAIVAGSWAHITALFGGVYPSTLKDRMLEALQK